MSESGNSEYLVVFQPGGQSGRVAGGKTVKEASQELGVDMEGVCGGKGNCGKCKVRLEEGALNDHGIESRAVSLSQIEDTERKLLSPQQQRDGYRLACQARIHGDVVLHVPEESRVVQQVFRKQATQRIAELQPAVRKCHLEMPPGALNDNGGDWERLQAELGGQFNLNNLTIDYQVLAGLQQVVRQDNWKVTASVWMDREVIGIEPGIAEKSYGLAVDIGTTTVAGYLCDLTSGEVVASDSMTNPQVMYGEDVMSRITYVMNHEDGRDRMSQDIIEGVNEIVGRVAAQAGITQQAIADMTVVGNTCMHHIFLNLDPQHAGMPPFIPSIQLSLDIKARDLGLEIAPGAYVHILPIIAGFVGADTVGVLIAEEPYNQDDMVLVIDIGTNGELVLGNRDGLVSCSCATGPAFEGANIRHGMRASQGAIERMEIDRDTRGVRFKVVGDENWNTDSGDVRAKGICGSGIVDGMAQLLMAGIIDRTGRFKTDLKTQRLRAGDQGPEFVIAWAGETSIGQDIVICQDDVRNVQLSKGAIYTGAKFMMNRLDADRVERVALAGAFGSYINPESAAIIGLFPDCALENICAVGNAAGDGACIALLNTDKRAEACRIARQVEYVELTLEPDFDMTFARAMWFPHMQDDFPQLKRYLPEEVSNRSGELFSP
jgi:uncharacterized 2Fe-2S/4Fe-4S cluster protein (DUF4445 family)